MVSMGSGGPVRFKWARYQPELTLPDPFRDQIRVFGPDFDLLEACILASEHRNGRVWRLSGPKPTGTQGYP